MYKAEEKIRKTRQTETLFNVGTPMSSLQDSFIDVLLMPMMNSNYSHVRNGVQKKSKERNVNTEKFVAKCHNCAAFYAKVRKDDIHI